MEKRDTCPICSSGELVPENYSDEIFYKNIRARISLFEHSVCTSCETSITDASQSKANKLLIIDFRRIIDGLLPSYEIHRIRKKLKLSIKDASKIIGGGGVAFSKYETGAINQSLAVDNLLRTLDDNPSLLKKLEAYHRQRELTASIHAEIFISFDANHRASEQSSYPILDFAQSFTYSASSTFQRVVSSVSRPINSFISFGAL